MRRAPAASQRTKTNMRRCANCDVSMSFRCGGLTEASRKSSGKSAWRMRKDVRSPLPSSVLSADGMTWACSSVGSSGSTDRTATSPSGKGAVQLNVGTSGKADSPSTRLAGPDAAQPESAAATVMPTKALTEPPQTPGGGGGGRMVNSVDRSLTSPAFIQPS